MQYGDLPQAVTDKLTLTLQDAVGVTVYASKTEAVRNFAKVERATGEPTATEFVHGTKINAQSAAAINAFAMQASQIGDSGIRSEMRASAVAVPAVLAAAEIGDISGRAFLSALAVSYEITDRLGRYLNRTPKYQLMQRGFMTSSICGAVGAAAGVAKALRFDEEKTASAIGLAAMGANGTFQYTIDVADGRCIHVARSQRIGLQSALLARHGFRPSLKSVEGKFGLLNAVSAEGDPNQLMPHNPIWDAVLYVKPMFFRTSNGFAIWLEALRRLRAKSPFANRDIRRIEILVSYPEGKALQNYLNRFRREPPTTIDKAIFDPRFTIALFLKHNSAFVDDYTLASLKDKEIISLSRLVQAQRDPALKDRHLLKVNLANGATLQESVLHSDIYDRPYTPEPERYRTKFNKLTRKLGRQAQQRIVEHMKTVENVESMRNWCSQLAALTKEA